MKAVLRQTGLSLRDVAGFAVGDVISLRTSGRRQVVLECDEYPVFSGKLGHSDGHYAVQVEAGAHHDDKGMTV